MAKIKVVLDKATFTWGVYLVNSDDSISSCYRSYPYEEKERALAHARYASRLDPHTDESYSFEFGRETTTLADQDIVNIESLIKHRNEIKNETK